MLIHQVPRDAAFAKLHTTTGGLTNASAAARRIEFGPNRLEQLPRTPLFRKKIVVSVVERAAT